MRLNDGSPVFFPGFQKATKRIIVAFEKNIVDQWGLFSIKEKVFLDSI